MIFKKCHFFLQGKHNYLRNLIDQKIYVGLLVMDMNNYVNNVDDNYENFHFLHSYSYP
jgi:hypothetical protein